jgi:preprotein translocase subunit SecD
MNSESKEPIKNKIVDILLNVRFLILIFFLLISFFTINYSFNSNGVVINGIAPNSLAQKAGIDFDSTKTPRNFEKIISINNIEIQNVSQFYDVLNSFKGNETLIIKTNLNQNGYQINIGDVENNSIKDLIGISVREAVSSNIRLGIDLEGGSRLILKPEKNLTSDQFDLLIQNIQNRLDVYGASGTKVNKLEDAFSKEKYVIVESISSNKNDIYELISRQGHFEAKIGNDTIFTGDNVLQVFTDAQHSRLEGCSQNSEGKFTCSFSFVIEIDNNATDAFFKKTSSLESNGAYLSEKVCFFLDNKNITCLNIASTFKYKKIPNPQISVSGNAYYDKEKAIDSAKKEMKFLQTVLSTKQLNSKLDIVESFSITASKGAELLKNALIVGLTSVLLVAGVIALRYRHFSIFISICFALIAELIIILGISAFMRVAIDLAAIGGLIAAIGTGVDDQIIITDEYFRKRKRNLKSRQKIKAALFIIMISYLTTVAAMLPLYFAGLKILQGFAFMIIIGVSIGVFITRPAYAAILRILMTTRKERKEEDEEEN